MIPEQAHRELQLKPFGWTGREAEWIALVCRHSGLFTHSQFCSYLHVRPHRARQFVRCLQERRQAVEEILDGLPASAHPCRISGEGIYHALGIENARHRLTASSPVLMRRLLALDYILEHPQQTWLTSEEEKVAAFDDLDIPRQVLPRRYCTRKGTVWVRYFPQEFPISISPGKATFVYAESGSDSAGNMVSWGSAHAPLWRALRQNGMRVWVVAVARDDAGLARDKKLLRRWTQGQWTKACRPLTSDEEQEMEEIRLAFFRSDWKALERWGGPQSALFYQRELKRRPAFENTESRFRIDRAESWRSQRLSFPGTDPS